MDEFKKSLSKLDPNKAKGPDGIHPRLLKELEDLVAKLLSLLFKLFLQTSGLPVDWWTASINPLFKKGSRTQPENYQSISLTLVVAKLIKGLVNDAIIAHMTKKLPFFWWSAWLQERHVF